MYTRKLRLVGKKEAMAKWIVQQQKETQVKRSGDENEVAGKYVLRRGTEENHNQAEEPQLSESEATAQYVELNSPTTKRAGIRDLDATHIQRILEFTYTEDFENANVYALQARLDLLEARWKDFDAAYFQLLDIPQEEQIVEDNKNCFAAGENEYLEAKAALSRKIDELRATPAEKDALTDRSVVRQLGDILSQDKLPVFNGDFTQWATFRDLFRIEVHENKSFTNSQKLKKLLNALEGAAKRAIGDWRITDGQGYEDACAALTRQYDNDYRTIRAHLQKIHEIKPMK